MGRRKDKNLTRKEIAQSRMLITRIRAGLPIRDSEWPADVNGKPRYPWGTGRPPRMMTDEEAARIVLPNFPAPRMPEDKRGASLEEYLQAMGLDETTANPAAIYWEAYDALERGERCESCGRGGPKVCRDCAAMLEGLKAKNSTADRAYYGSERIA